MVLQLLSSTQLGGRITDHTDPGARPAPERVLLVDCNNVRGKGREGRFDPWQPLLWLIKSGALLSKSRIRMNWVVYNIL